MGWTGRHPETGQPEPPRDVAHLHLLVSSTRVSAGAPCCPSKEELSPVEEH